MKFLLLFIISFSALGAYKAERAEIEKKLADCSYPLEVKRDCSGDCFEITKKFKCEYSQVEESKYLKEQSEACTDETDCISKFEALTCVSEGFRKVRTAEHDEVYCTKFEPAHIVENGAKKAMYDAKMLKKKNREQRIRKGHNKRIKSENALAYLAGMNEEEGKTEAEIDAMETTFNPIYDQLKKKRTKKAKKLIEAITDPAYDDLKAELLKILK